MPAPPSERHSSAVPYGINVIGHVTGNLGLAVAARNTIMALQTRGDAICVSDVDPGGGRAGHDLTYADLECPVKPPPFAVNLLHMNPPDIVNLMIDDAHAFEVAERLNVCVPFWELPRLPERYWVPLLDSVDLVLAPTLHVMAAVESSCPDATVRHYPQAVFLPHGVSPDRARWGIPEASFAVLMAMDVASDVERKNPLAALEAFRTAFPLPAGVPDIGTDSPRLVVKLNNTQHSRKTEDETAALLASLQSDPRVIVVDERMGYADALSLNASCDAYLSLHRAEGLGLNLLEAMTLGKPVVATAWSGNLDFMTAENSCLVDYAMRDVQTSHPSYAPDVIGPGQQWAEPDVAAAADWLARLADDPALRRRLGEAAARDMAARREAFLAGAAFDEVSALWRGGEVATARHAERVKRLGALRRDPYRILRRRVGSILRKTGLMR